MPERWVPREPAVFAIFASLTICRRSTSGSIAAHFSIQCLCEHVRFNFSAPVSVRSEVPVEMWHLSCRLNLHVDGYILENAHLIRDMIYFLAFIYHRSINLFDFLASLTLSTPHLQPITAPLSGEKKPTRDQ